MSNKPAIDVTEFNRRAAIALRGVTHTSPFIYQVTKRLTEGYPLSDAQQQALYNTVHGYRRQITDAALLEYAALKAMGAD